MFSAPQSQRGRAGFYTNVKQLDREQRPPTFKSIVKGAIFIFFSIWNLLLSRFWSVHLLQKWNTSPSKFSGCCQVILWNVGNHWVEVGRLRGSRQTKQVKFSALSLHLPGTDWTDWGSSLWIMCVCLRVCMNSDAFTHTTSSSSLPETKKRTMPSFFFFFPPHLPSLKRWHCIKSFCLFVLISGLSYKEMLQWHHRIMSHVRPFYVCL